MGELTETEKTDLVKAIVTDIAELHPSILAIK
jgi:hypothetical protein